MTRTRICDGSEVVAVRTRSGCWIDPYGGTFCDLVRYQVDDEDEEECTMDEFLDANLEALEDDEVHALLKGETVWLGGGAQPRVRAVGVRVSS